MTKTYALKRLLEHGPMTVAEIVDCTRWSHQQVETALRMSISQQLVRYADREWGCRVSRFVAEAPCGR